MRTSIAIALMLSLAGSARADDPALGATTYTTYDAFLSPAQEPGEESETPKPLMKSLGATKPSTPRNERKSRGHGRVRFTRDLTKAIVDVEIKGVADPTDILMFHIHCGPPGGLGPILVDLGQFGDLATALKGGKMTVEIGNDNLTWASMLPRGFKFKLPESCPTDIGWPGQVKTIAGMEYLARKGVLYFNLHTKQHTFYGEMRGQIYPQK